MGNSLKDKVFILISLALMLMCSTAEQEYFLHSENLTWADARNHCQNCYKDLVTVTPQNIQSVRQKLTSDCWVGLRENFSSTTMSWPGWTRWANGDPLVFQNWYPGRPVLKSSFPKSYCCSCSCTCPATPTPTMTSFTTSNTTSFTSVTGQSWTNSSGQNQSISTIAAACDRSPMLPDIPDTDENYIEDSCVAMLSFGAWVAKNCSELLPSICYEDIFRGQVSVTYVTKESANLSWLPGPGNISHYRLEVNGNIQPTYNLTNLTYVLVDLTAGTFYSVQVFPVKCKRDLNPQVVSFYTIPNKVENLNVAMVTETSVSLTWNKPAGGTVSYIINVLGENNQTNLTSTTENTRVDSLIPGNLYTFTVTSEVKDKSQRSEGSTITKYTKPSTVSNLKVSNITKDSLLLTWEPPEGNATSYNVKAVNDSNDLLLSDTVNQTKANVTRLPAGTKITLSVTALVNDTVEGDTVTIISYTVPNTVENLNVTMVTETSVSLSWNKPAGGTVSYVINVLGENIQIDLTSYTVNSLIPGNLYTFTVTSEVMDKSQRSEGSTITKYTKPSTVSNLRVSKSTTTSLLLKWTPPIGNATSYNVKAVNDSNDLLFSDTVNQTKANVTRLPAGTKITLSVTALVNDTVEGDTVTIISYTVPDKVENLNVTMVTETSVSLNWNKPVGGTVSYIINVLGENIQIDLTSYTVNSLIPGNLYTFTVTSKIEDKSQQSEESIYPSIPCQLTVLCTWSWESWSRSEGSTITKYTKPSTVSNLRVSKSTTTSLLLKWTPPIGNATSYNVKAVNDSNDLLFSDTVNQTKANVTRLPAGTKITLSVTALVNDTEEGDTVTIISYTVPNKVENLNVTMVTETSVSLSWNKPVGGTVSYVINVLGENIQIDLTSYTVNSLIPGNVYTFTVTSEVEHNSQQSEESIYPSIHGQSTVLCTWSWESWSRSEGSTITKYTKPSTVSNLKVSNITKDSLLLTWAPPIGNATSYYVKAVNDSNDLLFSDTVNQTKANVTRLPAGTKITLSVTALVNDTVEGDTVTIISYTVPNKVENLNVILVTNTSVSLSWNKPVGGTVSYVINVLGEKNQNIQTDLTIYTVDSLIPGNLYTFTVTSEVEDNSRQSEESIYPSIRCQPTVLCTWAWGSWSRSEGSTITKYTKPSTVSNLQVSKSTNTSLLLKWTPPIGKATSYNVKAVNDSNDLLFSDTVNQTKANVTRLPPGTKITLSVTALVNDTVEGDTVTIISYTVPNKVENLNVTMVTETSVSLSWNKPVGGTVSYIINVLGEKNQNIQTNRTSYTVNSLIPGNLYTFTVTSEVEDNSQQSEESMYPSIPCQLTVLCTWSCRSWSRSEESNITKYTKPSTVSKLRVSENTNTSLLLKWTPPIGNATSYNVKAVNDSNDFLFSDTVNQTNVTVTMLPPGTKITLSVTALVNDTVEGDTVTTVSYTAPNPISNLNLRPTNVSLNATWDPPNSGSYSSFLVVLQPDGQTLNTTSNETQTKRSFENLTAAVKYTVTVYSVSGNFNSTPVISSKFTLPNKVENLNVTMVNETSVSLSWNKPVGGTVSYIINVQSEKNQTNLTSTTENMRVDSLIPGYLYTFTVTSEVMDKSQRSEGSSITKYTKPSTVSNLQVSNITKDSLLLTWAPPIGNATSYYVKAVNDSNDLLFNNKTVKQTKENVTRLPAGTKITLSVTALVNDTVEGDNVTIANYTVPNRVENLNVILVTETSVSLSWNKPVGGTVSYIINVLGENIQKNQTNLTSITENMTVGSLIPGYLYTFTVTSEVMDKSQRSEESSITKYTKPSTVSNLQVYNITNTSLLLTWAPPIGNATRYNVKAVNDSNYLLFNNKTVKQTNVTVTVLPPGTKITLSVTALVNDTVEGDTVTTVNYTAPNPISNLNLRPTNVSLNATWDPPIGGSYSLFIVELQLGGQTLNKTSNETQRQRFFENLTAAAEYTVIVYSFTGNLSSTPVNKSEFTLPSPPTDITATSSTTSITFSWKAPLKSETVNYSVTISSSFWGSTESYSLNDKTTYTFNNLKSGTKYNFSVRSVAHNKLSDPTSSSYSTVPVNMTVSLSMLCSSAQILHCDNSTTRERIFQQLKEHFTNNWGDRIFWQLEKQNSEN